MFFQYIWAHVVKMFARRLEAFRHFELDLVHAPIQRWFLTLLEPLLAISILASESLRGVASHRFPCGYPLGFKPMVSPPGNSGYTCNWRLDTSIHAGRLYICNV